MLNCFLWFKDTKMKANHNNGAIRTSKHITVSYGSKILKWKQITTGKGMDPNLVDCFLWFKDTKMKANHNCSLWLAPSCNTVSYGSKILKWKQITTKWLFFEYKYYCFLWFKDTKMKANHNPRHIHHIYIGLFPMVQRY